MTSKYDALNSPEIYFKDCFNKNKIVCCRDAVFTQNDKDISDFIYTDILSARPPVSDENGSFLGVGLVSPPTPEHYILDVRTRSSKGIKTIPSNRFILSDMDASIIRVLRYARFNVSFEHVVISYVFSGEYNITIKGKTYNLQQGNAIIIGPNVNYSAIVDNDETVVFNINIKAGSFASTYLNLITDNNPASKLFINMLYNNTPLPYAIIHSPLDERISDLSLQLFDLYENKKQSVFMFNTLIQLFICQLFEFYSDCIHTNDPFDKKDVLAADIVSYLHKNYSTASLQDVSAQFSLSANYLTRLLKENVGMNYMSLIKDIKIEKAKDFLRGTDLSIEEICYIIGYSDPRQLRYLFKQKYGISPSEYRSRASLNKN